MSNRTRPSPAWPSRARWPSHPSAAQPRQDEQVTLQYWTWFPPLESTEKMIEAFEAQNPDIDVEITVFESEVYQDKMPLQLAAGDPLDVVAVQAGAMVDQLKGDLQLLEPLLEEHVGADWTGSVQPECCRPGQAAGRRWRALHAAARRSRLGRGLLQRRDVRGDGS